MNDHIRGYDMNRALWIVQVLWGVFFSVTGGIRRCIKCPGFLRCHRICFSLSGSRSFLEASA